MASTKSALLDLPVELQTAILSRLSAGQIQRFRRVCAHFKAVIDEPGNHSNLLGLPVAVHTERITHSINRLLRYPVDESDSFVTAFINFCKHRGLHFRNRGMQRTYLDLCAFAESWQGRFKVVENNVERLGRSAQFRKAATIILIKVIYWIPELIEHSALHNPTAVNVQQLIPMEISSALHLSTVDECQALLQRVIKDSVFADYHVWSTFAEGFPAGFPEFYVTPCARSVSPEGTPDDRVDTSRQDPQPITSVQNLADLFDLPSFDAKFFAYCAKSKWAYDRLKDCMAESGQPLGAVEKLAILEDLFFY